MLLKTGLERKDWITKKKTLNKLRAMIKFYKNMRETAN